MLLKQGGMHRQALIVFYSVDEQQRGNVTQNDKEDQYG